MTGTIYCLENRATDMMYIGQTTRPLHERLAEHKTGRGYARALDAAIAQYGWENFAYTIVEEIPVEDLDEAEKFWIAFCQTKSPNGYNLTEGGNGGNISAETKALMSTSALQRVEEGTHNFITDNPGPESNRRRMTEGAHNFLTDNPNDKRIAEGTHNFLTDNPNHKRMAEGTHHFLTDNPSHKRMADGTHNFITNSPMKNPEKVALRDRTRRRNAGILDWVDQLTEEENLQ